MRQLNFLPAVLMLAACGTSDNVTDGASGTIEAKLTESGWQCNKNPKTRGPVGHVFRVTPDRVKFAATNAFENEVKADESIVADVKFGDNDTLKINGAAGVEVTASMLGLDKSDLGVGVQANRDRSHNLQIELANRVERVTTDDDPGVTAAKDWYKKKALSDGFEYASHAHYLVRETAEAEKVKYIVGKSIDREFGAEGKFGTILKASGKIVNEDNQNYEIDASLDERYIICYKVERLVLKDSGNLGIGGGDDREVVLETVPSNFALFDSEEG